MKKCVIVGGADIKEYEKINEYINEGDFIVCCDCGTRHTEKLSVKPDLIVGDFDSSENPMLSVETIVLPREKDDTDTVFAVKEAVKRGFDEFLLIGVIGERFDHSMGNVSILLYLDVLGITAKIVDDFSEMEIVNDKVSYVDGTFKYFSLLNISGTAEGITVIGAKYPLENASISCEYQYGISNEVLPGETAEISVKQGRLLLVKIR
ncbi:MAG: thiamine diphosphokinase [Ruminococcaceae bacterium]|nr:thiamine diphosphokinase [Oscillospiraceae bacterium]